MPDFDPKPDLCIYHGPGCLDGFGAAWAVWSRWGDDVEYRAANYGQAPPDVTGKAVLIVDFSYPLETLRAMAGGFRRCCCSTCRTATCGGSTWRTPAPSAPTSPRTKLTSTCGRSAAGASHPVAIAQPSSPAARPSR